MVANRRDHARINSVEREFLEVGITSVPIDDNCRWSWTVAGSRMVVCRLFEALLEEDIGGRHGDLCSMASSR